MAMVMVMAMSLGLAAGAPFQHGVASGDPLSDRVILWTRVTLAQPRSVVNVSWLVARDPAMSPVVQRGSAKTNPARDCTVKVGAAGLQPGTSYCAATGITALGKLLSDGFAYHAEAPMAIGQWAQPSYDPKDNDPKANDQKGTFWRLQFSGVDRLSTVPEPASALLLALGGLALLGARARPAAHDRG